MEIAEVTLDINPELEELVFSSMSTTLDAHKRPGESIALPFTICKVPDEIRNVDPGAYQPQIVSIGPIHKGIPRLHAMEDIKWKYLQDLSDRNPWSNSLDRYIKEVSKPSILQYISECYSVEVIGAYSVDALVETMVLDGCFLVEFFMKYDSENYMGELEEGQRNRSLMMSDLLLIENQIPFFVLQVLIDATYGVSEGLPFVIVQAFCLVMGSLSHSLLDKPKGIHHLLHLCHTCFDVWPETSASPSWSVSQLIAWALPVLSCWRKVPDKPFRKLGLIRSATELYKAGISFKPKICPTYILDVTFRAIEGVVEIPLLSVDATTVSTLRNMVALERLLPAAASRFTSFAALMDILVDTPADVDLLVRSGVLENKLGRREDVTHFFNTLSKRAFFPDEGHYLKELIEDVNKYCAKERHRVRASFMHTYFTNPWTAMSLFAAVLLLLLTILQTFFAVFAYFRRS